MQKMRVSGLDHVFACSYILRYGCNFESQISFGDYSGDN
jgi:hypothetical protein